MATLFVKPTGNDANSGSSYANAKASITGAQSAAASGDIIVIATGLYNESASSGAGKNLIYLADGIVILDGTGLGAVSAILHTSGGIVMRPYVNGGKFVIRNYARDSTTTGVVAKDSSSTTVCGFDSVEFIGNAQNQVAFSGRVGAGSAFANCLFVHFSTAALLLVSVSTQHTVVNCTFHDCGDGVNYIGSGAPISGTYYISNIFSQCARAVVRALEPTHANCLDRNLYHDTPVLYRRNDATAVNYTTIASLQALSPAQELNTIGSTNPNFVNADEDNYWLKTAFPVGYIPFGLVFGKDNDPLGKWLVTPTPDNSGWYNTDGNVGKDSGSGMLVLVGGVEGVIDSPVIDLGAVSVVSRISLDAAEVMPTNVINTNNSGTPNYLRVRIRASGSTFAQDSATPSWVEVSRSSSISVTGRYIQLRLTLRSDGVAS